MAGGSVSGADELAALRQAIDKLPDEVTAQLRAVAERTAQQVQTRARELAPRDDSANRSKYTRGEPHLADSIVIIEDADHQAFHVTPETPWLPDLGNWLEYGTTRIPAQPFMRPAADAVDDAYRRDMLTAATTAVEKLLEK